PRVVESSRQKAAELARQRDQRQLELSQLRADLARKYGVAGGEVFELARVQGQLPAHAALVTWVHYDGEAKGNDANGEGWVCMSRRAGPPIGARPPGTGKDHTWTATDDEVAVRLRQECAGRPTMTEIGNELARKLYTQRLAPLEKHMAAVGDLPAVRHLIILPLAHMPRIPLQVLTEEVHPGHYVVSYAPSGTMFAWLREKRTAEARDRSAPLSTTILAVGDPVFGPGKPPDDSPPPPDHGVLITVVTPHSNAAKTGLKPGDVLLRHARTKLNSPTDLDSSIGKRGEPPGPDQKTIPLQVWRDGATFECKVEPGPLGVLFSKVPADQAIRAQREL